MGDVRCVSGQLDTTQFSCQADSCPTSSVVAPAHGSLGACAGKLLGSGTSCTPSCDAGYVLSGVSGCTTGVFTSATCNANPCAASAAPEHGSVGDCPASLASGSSCQPSCDAGYIVSGPSTCSLGTLSAAVCRADSCDVPAAPEHGSIGDCPASLSSGSACQPTCDAGYTANGPLTCLDGQLTDVTCSPAPCDASSPPSNGHSGNCSSTLQSGQACDPQCDGGYTALGSTRCLAGSLDSAQCVPDACDGMTAPTNGTIGDCTYRMPSGTSCQPTCNAGYVATGPSECHAGNLSKTRCDPQESSSDGSILWIALGTVGSIVLCVAATIYGIYLAPRSLRERELQFRADDLQLVV